MCARNNSDRWTHSQSRARSQLGLLIKNKCNQRGALAVVCAMCTHRNFPFGSNLVRVLLIDIYPSVASDVVGALFLLPYKTRLMNVLGYFVHLHGT